MPLIKTSYQLIPLVAVPPPRTRYAASTAKQLFGREPEAHPTPRVQRRYFEVLHRYFLSPAVLVDSISALLYALNEAPISR